MIARAPTGDVFVPDAIRELAAGRAMQPVWENHSGGLTFDIGDDADRVFVKWAPANSPVDLGREIVRLDWAAAYTPVPRFLGGGGDQQGTWMVTAPLVGESAVSERWKADPARAVAAIGHGLRALHDALPADECPFSWSAEQRVRAAQQRAKAGLQDPSRWFEPHTTMTLAHALDLIADIPPVDRLVVCQGDACAPNTLIADDGTWSGHVDVGSLGVGDRWADIAVATWSTQWNYGPGWEDTLLGAYGVERDEGRIAYYRLLWDMGP
ncbi:MAG: aminoglycoside 3'-phosphotransferase [Mycobacteriales bacterium]